MHSEQSLTDLKTSLWLPCSASSPHQNCISCQETSYASVLLNSFYSLTNTSYKTFSSTVSSAATMPHWRLLYIAKSKKYLTHIIFRYLAAAFPEMYSLKFSFIPTSFCRNYARKHGFYFRIDSQSSVYTICPVSELIIWYIFELMFAIRLSRQQLYYLAYLEYLIFYNFVLN